MSKATLVTRIQPPSRVTGEVPQPATTPTSSRPGQLILPQGQKVSIFQNMLLNRLNVPSQVLIQVAENTAGAHQYALRETSPKTDEEMIIINEMKVLRSEWSKSREEKGGQNNPKKKKKQTFLDLKLQATLKRLIPLRTLFRPLSLSKKRAKKINKN